MGIQYNSAQTQTYISYFYDTYIGQKMWISTSFVEHPQTGVTAIFSEIGLLGGFLYYLTHLVVPFSFLRSIKKENEMNSDRNALMQGLVLCFVGYLILSTVWDVFNLELFRCGLWFCAGLVWESTKTPTQPLSTDPYRLQGTS